MKKILSIFVVLMYMLSGIAYAQDTTEETVTADPVIEAIAEEVTTEEVEVETTEVSEETTAPEAMLTSEPAPETTDDSGITAVVTAPDGTVISDEEVADEVETEEDVAEVTATEEAVETEEEVETMTQSPAGVEVRVTQLQERLERAIAHGEGIIADVTANGGDATALQAALDTLVALKADVAAISVTGDVSEITAQFVAIKKAAITAVKEFRTAARKEVKAEKRAALKAKLEAKAAARTVKLQERIAKAKAKFNGKVTTDILAELGESNPELAAQIAAGEISAKDARKLVVGSFKELSKERKSEAKQKLTERKAEIKVKRTAAVEKSKERKVERVEQVKSRNNRSDEDNE